MKKLIGMAMLLVATLSFGQELEYKKGSIYLQGNKISTSKTKELLKANPEALQLFSNGKDKAGVGGLLLGLGAGLCVSDLLIGLTADNVYPGTYTYIGLGAIVVSIPIYSGYKKNIRKAIELYNQKNATTSSFSNLELDFVLNGNGGGLSITF